MSRDPERLLASDASDIERRLIEAIAQERPSSELRSRMAQGIGLSVAGLGASAGVAATEAGAAGAKTAVAVSAGPYALLPWISVGVLGLAVTAAIVGVRAWKAPVRQEPRPPAVEVTSAPVAEAPRPPTQVLAPPPVEAARGVAATPSQRRSASASARSDLREQIALLDAARGAVSASDGARALGLLRQYQDTYPAGTFRPEAAALRIEALAKLGRRAEARALAQRFIVEYGESPQADRVSRIAGLGTP